MPPKAITWAQDDPFTGGLCLVARAPKSNDILLEPAAPGRAPDTGPALMEQALAGLHGQVIQATSDEAPGLLAYVAPHLGAHHSPDLCHVPPALVKAVAGPMAAKQRAAAKAATEAQERFEPGQRHVQGVGDAPQTRGPGRPPQAAASLAHLAQDVHAPRLEHQRLSAQREQVALSLRSIGQVYPVVD